jgi:hypothetical protein
MDPQTNVLVVLPIAKQFSNVDCKAGRFPFKIEKPLPTLQPGKYLLHVRSMNGQAINKLFEIEGGSQ